MEEFNKKFNDLVKSLDAKIRPPEDAILIHYMESFDGEIRYQLRDKEPTNLKYAQKLATKIEKNLQAFGKSIFLVSQGALLPNLMKIRRRNQKLKNPQVILLKNLPN